MARRTVLTGRQRDALLALPDDEPTLLQHHVLNDVDLGHIRRRRRPQNRLGFAFQLCALRYPGRLLQPGEVIPEAMLAFIGAQIGLSARRRRSTKVDLADVLSKTAVFDTPTRSGWGAERARRRLCRQK